MSIDDKSKQMSQDAFWELAKRAGDPPTSILAAGPPMTIDDERAAFISDLLRVLTSLYSWAGAVVNGQTADGHDVIELCDKTLVFTAAMNMDPWWEACMVFAHHGGNRSKRPNPIGDINSYSSRERMIRYVASWAVADLVEYRIRDLLTGPPEDA